MKQNVGICDALIRITFGLMGLSYGIARLARYPYRTSTCVLIMLSALKVAEGITRFCPLLALLDISTINGENKRPYRIRSYPRCRR
ncbi:MULTISPECIES: DUF2892 domain-containing protein [Aneurinibacillus]|uniref:DUF2892 domain-containing protein n=1 Tax=Aneurinibacillus thermoaerophilus TaxID=143495 RepID=A0A1G8ARF0_ANETH|nr:MULTISPECIES: DUF2892 domain-containing protein [Aneurinibacillus]AMA74222.1 hypothetical protein ACH33_16270 [Aneurinibacillus sp. XH2]MED0676784.1 DUF2892 domain-containing protein [Aneurinibacillus thermoaerophilus]MED0680996.1 DUF2892 domain-containing protein [Aneurinibacillus thermoaerophilus]MED0738589.1 DUF2892 domain-containing protein [Aneurinibacillus thermoaerophilus]MED0758989.1 DUF2892 domain-containing protein [Aneurinibacillus thermoaerophilus]